MYNSVFLLETFNHFSGYYYYSIIFMSLSPSSLRVGSFLSDRCNLKRLPSSRDKGHLKNPILLFKTFVLFSVCFKIEQDLLGQVSGTAVQDFYSYFGSNSETVKIRNKIKVKLRVRVRNEGPLRARIQG
jgi:hypothetical protein